MFFHSNSIFIASRKNNLFCGIHNNSPPKYVILDSNIFNNLQNIDNQIQIYKNEITDICTVTLFKSIPGVYLKNLENFENNI